MYMCTVCIHSTVYMARNIPIMFGEQHHQPSHFVVFFLVIFTLVTARYPRW